MAEPVKIDLSAIQGEVAKLNTDQIREELLKFKVRQKVQQKKQQGSNSQKAYQQKQRERIKLMKAKAIELGLWDDINDEAEKLAEENVAEEKLAEKKLAEKKLAEEKLAEENVAEENVAEEVEA
jgi:hypothetical protein